MLHGRSLLVNCSFKGLLFYLFGAITFHVQFATSVTVPSSNCYALDNSSYLYDFTDLIGHPFEYDGKDTDLVVRFCKDVETRSQPGYFNFGRYYSFRHVAAGSGPVNFVQRFYRGDLLKCELSFDKMGRNSQVNVLCGDCLDGACKGGLGCICDVKYDATMCSAIVELAIPCAERGPRVFEGFTVGFHPRTWEVVYNGMTQLGFEKPHPDFSFATEQTHVSLYLTAISAVSDLVGKPTFKVYPEKGLEVTLSGSGSSGIAPTTLAPTDLIVNWRCENARNAPYEVVISIPVEGYDPIDFTLTKLCGYTQRKEGEATTGWAIFGVISCIFVALATISCCGGFIYKTRVENQRGLDALPGMTVLSACLETVTRPQRYPLRDDTNANFISPPSWEKIPGSTQGTQTSSERNYGSI